MPGEQFVADKYRLLERLGEGGMGTVFRARDELLDRDVAIKQLRPELVSEGALSERFRAEAMVLARLNHPCIAALHGLERQDGCFYMVMEYLPGQTLEALVEREGALPWRRAVDIACAVLDALEHAHARGVVHRDIKPANIMITPDGGVKVMDFGIARVMGRTRHTRTGHAVGTPAYMAPEQLRGEEVDGRADLYALATVLYELVTGRVAFEADSDYRLMMMQLHDTPPPPGTLAVGVPGELDRVVGRAMAKRPGERYTDAAAMRAALARVASTADAGAAAAGAPGPVSYVASSLSGASAAIRAGLARAGVGHSGAGAWRATRAGWREEVASWMRDWRGWVTAGCLLAAAMFTVRAVSPRPTWNSGYDAVQTPVLPAGPGAAVPGGPGLTGVDAGGAPAAFATGAGGNAVDGSSPAPSVVPSPGARPGSYGTEVPPAPGGMRPAAPPALEGASPLPGSRAPAAPSARRGVEAGGGRGGGADGGRGGARRDPPAAGTAHETPGSASRAASDRAPEERGGGSGGSDSEPSRREAAMSAAAAFLRRIAAGDASAAGALAGGGVTGELSTLVRERRVAGASARDISMALEGERARATASVDIAWRTAFGGNRRGNLQLVMELRRQGAEWRVDAARVTGGELR